MATPQEQHRAKWHSNRRFIATISDDHPDWMVVAVFYTALHAVETLMRYDNVPPHNDHTKRNGTLKQINRYRKVWEHYRELLDASRSARYDADATNWIPAEQIKTELVKRLYRIEKSVLKLIDEEGTELGPIWPS